MILYTIQAVPLKQFSFKFLGKSENDTMLLGPGIYLADNANFTKNVYGKRGRFYKFKLQKSSEDFIYHSPKRMSNIMRKKFNKAAESLGFDDIDDMSESFNSLRHGRWPVGPFTKLLGPNKARKHLIKHGILGMRETLPSGVEEYAIYDLTILKPLEIILPDED